MDKGDIRYQLNIILGHVDAAISEKNIERADYEMDRAYKLIEILPKPDQVEIMRERLNPRDKMIAKVATKKVKAPNLEPPNLNELMEQALYGGTVTLDCGCVVEPDGHCHHGNKSPLLEMGMI